MPPLPYQLDRIILIRATRETVFRFFTDSARWAAWWGAGSSIDARPGGAVRIRYPGGVEVSGEVVEILAPARLVFTYGYTSGTPIPAGASLVTIRLDAEGADRLQTRLHLTHEFADASVRDEHVQGWRYQLSLFGNAVADEVHAGAPQIVDDWFAAWNEPDARAREETFARSASPAVQFKDRFSLIDGIADLVTHAGALQRFMPGIRMQRRGDVRHCQGTLLVDWIWLTADGQERATGTNVFVLGPDGRIESAAGFMEAKR